MESHDTKESSWDNISRTCNDIDVLLLYLVNTDDDFDLELD